MADLSLFIGFTEREAQVSDVCAFSVKRRASIPVDINLIKLEEMRAKGLYTRPTEMRGNRLWDIISDAPMSTEFAISRFLTPHLSKTPWAIFCDNDFLWRDDIAKLFKLADPKYAVMCVQHVHIPPESTKLDNQAQLLYARKNWSSMTMYNCQHPSNRALTLETINTVPGRDLHRFFWLKDEEIGSLPHSWNWIENHSDPAINPSVVHYTKGGPWYPETKDCAYGQDWFDELAAMKAAGSAATKK